MTRLDTLIADNPLSGGDIAILTHVAILPGCTSIGVSGAQVVRNSIFSHAYVDEKLNDLAERGLIARHPSDPARFLISGDV